MLLRVGRVLGERLGTCPGGRAELLEIPGPGEDGVTVLCLPAVGIPPLLSADGLVSGWTSHAGVRPLRGPRSLPAVRALALVPIGNGARRRRGRRCKWNWGVRMQMEILE